MFGALAHHEQLPFEGVLIFQRFRTTDEDLTRDGFKIARGFGQNGVVDRHIAPAEKFEAFFVNDAGQHRFTGFATGNRLRQEDVANSIVANWRQAQALLGAFGAQEGIRQLDQNPCAIAEHFVVTGSATVFQILKNQQAFFDDVVALLVLDVRDKTDTAGVVFIGRVI